MDSPSPAPRTPDQPPMHPTDPITPSSTHSNISSPGIIRNQFPRNPFAAPTAFNDANTSSSNSSKSSKTSSSSSSASPTSSSSPTHADLALKCEVLRLSNTYNEREVHRLKSDRQTLETNASHSVAEIQALISCNEELRVLRREHEATAQEISNLQSRLKDLRSRRKQLRRLLRHLGLRNRRSQGTKRQSLDSLISKIASHCNTLRTQTKNLRTQTQALLYDRRVYLTQISNLQQDLQKQYIFIHGLQLFVERVVREKTELEMVLAGRVKELTAGQKALVRKQLDKEDRERAQRRIRDVPDLSSPPKGQPRGRRRSWHGEIAGQQENETDPIPTSEREASETTIASLQAEVESERMEKERIQGEEKMAVMTCLFFIFFCILVVVWNSQMHAPAAAV